MWFVVVVVVVVVVGCGWLFACLVRSSVGDGGYGGCGADVGRQGEDSVVQPLRMCMNQTPLQPMRWRYHSN